jgi:hypothetical protein
MVSDSAALAIDADPALDAADDVVGQSVHHGRIEMHGDFASRRRV